MNDRYKRNRFIILYKKSNVEKRNNCKVQNFEKLLKVIDLEKTLRFTLY